MKQKKTLIAGVLIGITFALSACGPVTKQQALNQLEEGDYINAIATYEHLLDEEETKAEAYMGLSLAYFKNADYDKCLDISEQGIKENGTDKAVLYNRCGIIYLMNKDYSAAQEAFDKGLKEPQVNENVEKNMMWNRIILLEENGDNEKARDYLERYLRRWPDDEDAVHESRFLSE